MAAAYQEGEVEWELCNEGGDPTEGRPVGHASRDEEQDPQPHPPPSQEFLPMMDEMILEVMLQSLLPFIGFFSSCNSILAAIFNVISFLSSYS